MYYKKTLSKRPDPDDPAQAGRWIKIDGCQRSAGVNFFL
jgi:hypothetical protein